MDAVKARLQSMQIDFFGISQQIVTVLEQNINFIQSFQHIFAVFFVIKDEELCYHFTGLPVLSGTHIGEIGQKNIRKDRMEFC